MKITRVDLTAALKGITRSTLVLMDDQHLDAAEDQLIYLKHLTMAEYEFLVGCGTKAQERAALQQMRRVLRLLDVAEVQVVRRGI